VRPACLELEVLETSALQDIVHVSEIMKACRDIGVNFALDDFGTGYASLSYLKRLPAHTLKIDQSFILTMLDDPEDLRIVDGVLGLANAFHRTSIAEGVETYAHAQRLIQLGCELAQGYGIARPMPAGDFPAWARRWSEAPLVFPLPPIRRESLPLMFVITEHRAWVRQIERRLRQEAPVPAMEHQDACAFADWLRTRAGHWVHDAALLEAILQRHDALHACAARLLALSTAAGEDDIGALHAAMDAFEHAVNGALT